MCIKPATFDCTTYSFPGCKNLGVKPVIQPIRAKNILHSLNSTAVNGDVFIKNLQGGTFAFEHLYLQILDSRIPYEVFCG
jgi:hypothetical protein